ncbi:hypothetical protein [Candidatus Ichthyocystis hellenicum]|uniref:hypothetical protein n=1 Tax=Candidatus Ichthyocystis hellenicum TaxID=1561003 RepID=UPI000B8A058B|nr:hypothetical protein [Candidatus Ichthyocystis hellenicum]
MSDRNLSEAFPFSESSSSVISVPISEESDNVILWLLKGYFSYLSNHLQPTFRSNFTPLMILCGNCG